MTIQCLFLNTTPTNRKYQYYCKTYKIYGNISSVVTFTVKKRNVGCQNKTQSCPRNLDWFINEIKTKEIRS